MISPLLKFKLLTVATKYGVEIIRFIPGNVVVQIASWNEYERKFMMFLEDVNDDPSIKSIVIDRGIVDIHYEQAALDNPVVIDRLVHIFESYSF